MRSNLEIVREKIAALREALLNPTPEAIEACLPGLVEAITLLQNAGLDWTPAPRLLDQIRAVQKLIEHGEKMNRDLARILGSQLGYTVSGDPAPIAAAGSISVQG